MGLLASALFTTLLYLHYKLFSLVCVSPFEINYLPVSEDWLQ